MTEILHHLKYISMFSNTKNSYTFGIWALYKVMQDFYHKNSAKSLDGR